MMTDPARKRRSDPGNPDLCPVFDLHKIFPPEAPREAGATGCRTAGIGCLDCKAVLLTHMVPPLAGIRERRERFAAKPREIVGSLPEGSRKAREFAKKTRDERPLVINFARGGDPAWGIRLAMSGSRYWGSTG